MHELPIASFLATEIVRRRLRYGDDTTPTRPARSVR